MELSEKNGQASMEEILASIRRIIAEEPAAASPVIQLNPAPVQAKGDQLLDDPSDFDLPSMFRNGANGSQERPAPLLGRLTDAIRAASGAASADAPRSEMSLSSLKLPRPATPSTPHFPEPAPSFQLSAFHESTVGQRTEEQAVETAHPEAPIAPEPVVPDSVISAPEVPRQMAPFKDTRFRSMGAQPALPPVDVKIQAVAALTSFSSSMASAAETAPPAVAPAKAHDNPEAVPAVPALSYPAVGMVGEGRGAANASSGPFGEPFFRPAMPSAPATVATQDSFASAPIEDTAADLLRPMLRQWLAENMPRMVEKALHIEIAEAVKLPKKP